MRTRVWQWSAVAPAIWLILLVIAALPAQAQFDYLSDEDRCYLGQLQYCENDTSDSRPDWTGSPTGSGDNSDSGSSSGSGSGSSYAGHSRGYQPTCPNLPPGIEVFAYKRNTHCQVVDAEGVGRADLTARGILAAVDIWNDVPQGVEVCFHARGELVFLDAAFAPRLLAILDGYVRDSMTCAEIPSAGTVALLKPLAEEPAAPETAPPGLSPTLPELCVIKLTETLRLRAEPLGTVIDLVWLHSEVPVFEVTGHWYGVEFKGRQGYISRFHRTVLHGLCGV